MHSLKEYELSYFKFRYSQRALKRYWKRAGCALPRRCALDERS